MMLHYLIGKGHGVYIVTIAWTDASYDYHRAVTVKDARNIAREWMEDPRKTRPHAHDPGNLAMPVAASIYRQVELFRHSR